ncbi:hypothetical protein [Actinophytocola oryzae]|uniref:Excreted virulence factor EspC (Type VII ESX diderm) n=1 Tax=Actinophytocola oryzae TaxID=502181 RepID=A0A4R7V3B4_9PSEU|nr:hypothetical protein [Actinophytocola oryzae]TDV43087.1 hypothetical protein CLV71_11621 [Actinophytocola oryzae]
MADIDVVADELRNYALYLRHEPSSQDIGTTVRNQATRQGCDEAGFTGLLEPLTIAMRFLREQVGRVCDIAQQRLNVMGDALIATADDYQHVDHENQTRIQDSPRETSAS